MRRNTIVLAVLLALLAGYYYFFELGKSDKDTKEKLFVFKAEEAAGVSLDYQGRAIVLQKQADGRWKMTAPIATAADDAAVGGLLTTLSSAAIKRTVEKLPTEADLKNFSLEPPTVKVSVTLKSGLTLPGITVGARTPLGDSTYAQRAKDPAVYLTDGSLGAALDKQVEEFRDRTVLPFPSEPIARLEINMGSKSIVAVRGEKDTWNLESPVKGPAKADAVSQYIASLSILRARSFIDNETDAKKYGLEKPAIRISLGGQGGKTLAAVEAGQSGNAYFARREGDPTIFAIDEGSYKALFKDEGEFKGEEKKAEEKKEEIKVGEEKKPAKKKPQKK